LRINLKTVKTITMIINMRVSMRTETKTSRIILENRRRFKIMTLFVTIGVEDKILKVQNHLRKKELMI